MPRGRPKGSKNNSLQNSKQTTTVNDNLIKDPDKKQEISGELKKAVSDLTKQFGHDIIHFAYEEKDKERIAFPIERLTKMTGGGIPLGMYSILWGSKSCAKTTLVYYLIAQAQKMGKICLFMDLENSFDKIWSEKCGIDLNRLLVAHFENAEESMDTAIKLSKEKLINFIIFDSIQSLSPEGEQTTKKGIEKSTTDNTMGLLARKLSQFFRMNAGGIYRGEVAVLLIGQSRFDLGSLIKLEKISGGNALEHWAVMTLRAFRGAKSEAPRYKFEVKGKTKEIIIGFNLNIRLDKTKISGTAPQDTVISFPFYYEYGFTEPTEKQIKELYGDWIQMESEE